MKLKIAFFLYTALTLFSACFVGINAKNPIQAMGIQLVIGVLISNAFLFYAYKHLKIN